MTTSEMHISDLKTAADLLGREWNLGKKESGASGSVCSWIYLMAILKETEQMLTIREKGKLIGFCGYSNIRSRKHRLQKHLYGCIEKALLNSWMVPNKEALKEYLDNYDYCPEGLVKDFDGEISILIVAPEYRGKGFGKRLLSDTFKLAAADGMHNLCILTDDSCNHRFYESLGCTVVYETEVVNLEQDKLGISSVEKAYVYKKQFSPTT